MRLAIFPARGGSKRIPRKNVAPFAGRPMLSWAVSAAVDSGVFDDIVVSTDDEEIAESAVAAGAAVPFRRPSSLADDYAPARAVFIHALEEMERLKGAHYAEVCGIFPTAPFLTPDDLRSAHKVLDETKEALFVFSAATYTFPIQRALRFEPGGGVALYQPEHITTRSQDLEEAFHDAGQFYWGRREAFLSGHPMFSAQSRPYFLPRSRVQDIDTPEDWDVAERLFAIQLQAAPA